MKMAQMEKDLTICASEKKPTIGYMGWIVWR